QDERHGLDGVVVVDLEVAAGPDRQVEQAVVGERAEEMIVEADAGRDVGVAGPVEIDGHGHVGLAGRPRHRRPPALARANVDRAEGGRHGAAFSISRAAVTTETLTVDTEPGGRNGAIRAIVSGRAIAKPTRSPARA